MGRRGGRGTSAKRLNVLPDVPPIGDFLSGYETNGWYGLGAPAGTSVAIIDKLNLEIKTALADPTFTARFVDLGIEPFASSPAEFGKFIAEFADKWGKLIRATGIKLG
jgi:tripartite-type tricarboxylate transporter receptor subunit TctC